VRILIAEDQFLLREGMVRLLRACGCQIAAAVDNGPDLEAALLEEDVDVAVIDVRLPPTFTDEGVRAAVRARLQRPGLPVLVLSQYVETLYAQELLSDERGGVGYLLKDRVLDTPQFYEALQRVAAGGTCLDPEVVVRLLRRQQSSSSLDLLTPRELQTLSFMAEGRSNTAIAKAMSVTDNAVAKHVSSIFSKLGLTPSDEDHRRIIAVLRYLDAYAAPGPAPELP
jgi:DNA-binding NarL/FixJ family response regulator